MAEAEKKGLTRRSMLGTTAVAAVAGAAGAATGLGLAQLQRRDGGRGSNCATGCKPPRIIRSRTRRAR